jgi:hypothetical protein
MMVCGSFLSFTPRTLSRAAPFSPERKKRRLDPGPRARAALLPPLPGAPLIGKPPTLFFAPSVSEMRMARRLRLQDVVLGLPAGRLGAGG